MGNKKVIWIIGGVILAGVIVIAVVFSDRLFNGDGESFQKVQETAGDFPLPHTYAEAEESSNCSVYLFHQLGGQKEDWDPYISDFTAIGCDVLAIDFSGHGEAEGDYNDFSDEEWQQLPQDAGLALQYGVEMNPDHHHWMIGASIGSNSALIASAQYQADVSGAILLSPGLDYRGVKPGPAAIKYAGPLFLAASAMDTQSFESTLELMDLSTSPILKTVDAPAGHGLEMFESKPGLMKEITDFITTVNNL